jgi:sugar/nucleoside kinase (ribokinase family)
VTRGQLGAEARLDGRTESVRPTRIAPEGPGSGDAFAATLLVALSQGDDLRQALERASQAALDSLG